jgi:hypothetical protein
MDAFGNRTLSDLGGCLSEINALSSENNPLRSLRVRLPNAPHIFPGIEQRSRQLVLWCKISAEIFADSCADQRCIRALWILTDESDGIAALRCLANVSAPNLDVVVASFHQVHPDVRRPQPTASTVCVM